jgi:fructan beta-fructosidase
MNPGGYQAGSGARYFVGHFDGYTFKADNDSRVDYVDYGADFYAVTSFFDGDNKPERRTAIGWMSNWNYSSSIPTAPWRGQMSFPRDYTLG